MLCVLKWFRWNVPCAIKKTRKADVINVMFMISRKTGHRHVLKDGVMNGIELAGAALARISNLTADE